MPHLLIIGATGVLGSAAAKHFLEKGFRVSAFVRNKDKAAGLERSGARLVIGDLSNPSTFENIFNTVDVVLTAAHAMLGKGKNRSGNVDGRGHQLLIEGAKKAGVKQFIYSSVHGVSPDSPIDFFRTKYQVEQQLIHSGLTYTILRLPAFMEWHAYLLLGKKMVEKGKTTILGKGENTMNFIAIQDVVAALDKIVLNEKYFNSMVPLLGPQNFSRNEVAALFAKALNKPARINHVPVGMVKMMGHLFRPFHEGLARIMKFSALDINAPEVDQQLTISQFGLKPFTLEEFIHSIVHK